MPKLSQKYFCLIFKCHSTYTRTSFLSVTVECKADCTRNTILTLQRVNCSYFLKENCENYAFAILLKSAICSSAV